MGKHRTIKEYPEHKKLLAVVRESQAIGEFLDMGPHTLCDQDDRGHYHPVQKSIQQQLADWFGIDLKKIEAEKQEMLEEMRNIQDQRPWHALVRAEAAM